MLLHEHERTPETPERLDPELLIEEARRRGRRRRLAWITVATAAAAGALLGFALTRGSTASNQTNAGDGRGLVTSLDLSRSGPYESLALVDGRLILSGGPQGSLFPSASIASSPHSGPSGLCRSAIVDPDSLKLSGFRSGPCEDPPLYGVRVLPVNFVANGQGYRSTIRIARTDTSARRFSVGPVVVRYAEASDTDAEWVYGDGYLWIYEPMTTRGSELLQISTTTGAVVDRIPMPVLARPLLATDEDGLWLVPAINSTFSGRPALALYHVAPGARRPAIVARAALGTTVLAHWLVAAGHSVWVDVNHYPHHSTLWRLDGPGARPVYHRTASPALDYMQFGYGESEYGGDETALWAVVPHAADQRTVRIDPDTGRSTTVATVRPPAGYETNTLQPPLVVAGGSAFFLDPPQQAGTYPYRRHGFSALYRVALR